MLFFTLICGFFSFAENSLIIERQLATYSANKFNRITPNDTFIESAFESIFDFVNDRDIVLNSDGTAIRAFCYVADTVTGIIEVMVNGENTEAYNLANETEPYMIRDVAKKLVDLYPEKGLKVVFSNPSDEVKKGYVSYKIVKLDTSKLESLGWSPKVELEEGMKRTVDSFILQRKK